MHRHFFAVKCEVEAALGFPCRAVQCASCAEHGGHGGQATDAAQMGIDGIDSSLDIAAPPIARSIGDDSDETGRRPTPRRWSLCIVHMRSSSKMQFLQRLRQCDVHKFGSIRSM